jgi:HEPN domain
MSESGKRYTIAYWVRAADSRLTAARTLYAAQLYLDAMYIGGYTAECALKALVLARTPTNRRKKLVDQEFRGSKAHSLDHWMSKLKHISGLAFSTDFYQAQRTANSWDPWWRYTSQRVEAAEARTYLDAVGTILDAVRKMI